MSQLVPFAGFSEYDLLFDQQPPAAESGAPVHCGTPMELVTPAVGPTAVGYSFEPANRPEELPPVWRCGCGFQLDAWVLPCQGATPEAIPAHMSPTR